MTGPSVAGAAAAGAAVAGSPADARDIRRTEGGEKARVIADLRAAIGDGPHRGDAHAVVIGIDRYVDTTIPALRYARADAVAVHAALVDPEVGRFDPEHVTLLVDEAATRAAILTAIGALRRHARDADTVVVYFAGHGAPEIDIAGEAGDDGLQKFLVPYDAQRTELYATAIPMDEVQRLFGRVRARSLVFLLDACYSGNAGGRSFARADLGTRAVNLSDRFLKAMAGEGRCVITSCDVNEVSVEPAAYGHGLFTHYLLEGLRGAADADGDGAVDVDELYRYLSREVPEAASQVNARMRPVLTGQMRGSVVLSLPDTPALRRARALRADAARAEAAGDAEAAERLWREAAALDPADAAAPAALAAIAERRERARRAQAESERRLHEELGRRVRVLREHFDGGRLTGDLFAHAVEVLEADAAGLAGADRSLRRLVDALVDGQLTIDRFNKAARHLAPASPLPAEPEPAPTDRVAPPVAPPVAAPVAAPAAAPAPSPESPARASRSRAPVWAVAGLVAALVGAIALRSASNRGAAPPAEPAAVVSRPQPTPAAGSPAAGSPAVGAATPTAEPSTPRYELGFYALHVRQTAFDSVHASLKERGYDLVRGGIVDTRPSWMSDRSTVLYYDAQSREQAGRLAGELRALTGQPFAVQLGRGLGVTPGHERSTFFIHWIASRPPVRPVPKPTAPPTVRMRS